MRIIRLAMVGLLASMSQQAMAQANSSLDDDLRRSQLCAKAAKEFRSQPEWKNPTDMSRTFTSHFISLQQEVGKVSGKGHKL
jgi:hypothetical protein